MKRQALTDGTGRWFNLETADSWDESCIWDGRNQISNATGSQWDHQRLYRTKTGRWIINGWSQWEGSLETWTEISPVDAAMWFARNGHAAPHGCSDEFAALEL
jgi:hypothetical protein